MNRFFHLSLKGMLLASMLLTGLLVGCGSQGNSARSAPQGKPSPTTQTPQGRCPAQAMSKDAGASGVAYTVSWDAVARDADTNQGVSALHVSALDIVSGKIVWKKSPVKVAAMYQSSQQQVVDGVLYIASVSSQRSLLLAVDTRDGHALWQQEEKQADILRMSICAGKLYLIGQASLQTLRASDGQVLWSYSDAKASMVDCVVTTQAASILLESRSGEGSVSVITLGANDGQVVWKKSYDGQQGWRLSLVGHEQTLYVLKQVQVTPSQYPMTPVASIQALDGKSGNVIWTAHMPPNMEQIRVLHIGNTLYLNGQNLVAPNQLLLLALNASNGKQRWQRQHTYNQITVLSEHDLYGYKGYGNGDDPQGKKQLCSLDGTTGKDRWCVERLQPSQFSLSATRDMLIVEETLQPSPMTLVQNIYGVSKHDGKLLWKLPWKSSSTSVVTLTLVTVVEGQGFASLVG